MAIDWDLARWMVVFGGIADIDLFPFDADGWQLRHGAPAAGRLGILPIGDNPPITVDDAAWLADCIAFDHDAPIGIQPRIIATHGHAQPVDDAARVVREPVIPLGIEVAGWHWSDRAAALDTAAELRFNGSYRVRYVTDDRETPSTDFSVRFDGREARVSLYAMAARQSDPLAEYLLLYRVLEAADGTNGKAFIGGNLDVIGSHRWGVLRVHDAVRNCVDAFRRYEDEATQEFAVITKAGETPADYLYGIRNRLAHGKVDVLAGGHGPAIEAACRALPIVKLLARHAIDPVQ